MPSKTQALGVRVCPITCSSLAPAAGGPGCPQKIGPRLVTRSSGLFRLDVIMAPWAMRFCAAARAPTAVLRIGLPPEPSLAPVQRV